MKIPQDHPVTKMDKESSHDKQGEANAVGDEQADLSPPFIDGTQLNRGVVPAIVQSDRESKGAIVFRSEIIDVAFQLTVSSDSPSDKGSGTPYDQEPRFMVVWL